ncbi:MAG: acryloyl-CoA reductase [Hydrocarboniphaga sp.]|uniref:alcohol dehydrogenase catalytic domain-containing protein n=1 Tax=Hydrocarboniphaga sp. TaxID=2033016 RepID=UPI00260DA3D2|nr:alcohol dehydrogenase catalytic domain-containing protein [Hydrocarboniphaga sp.]MDB5968676.1 acryloyl-CoA reductase [Hydrocarboniphaga sp.]
MTSFKALRIHQAGKSTSARFDRITLDDLHAGDSQNTVTIRVAYSGLNYKDALAVTGKGRIMRRFPCVAGIDLSGVVESSDSPAFKPGDPVLVTGCYIGEVLDGGLAEFARVPAEAVVPLPENLSLFEAMAFGTAGFTAALALRRMLDNHQSPELGPIAVTGATGGVGGIALGLLKRAGFSTAAITGKKHQAEYLQQLGADQSEHADRDARHRTRRGAAHMRRAGGRKRAWAQRRTHRQPVRPKSWGTSPCRSM